MISTVAGAAACDGTPVEGEGAAGAEDIVVSRGALAPSEWTNGWNTLGRDDGSLVASATPPVGCEAQYESAGGQALFQTDAAGHIDITWKSYSSWSPWVAIGASNVSFTQQPACAGLDGAYDTGATRNKQIAVLGRGASTSRYWIAIWKLGTVTGFNVVPTQGTLVHDWATISNDAYAGAPAATVHKGKLLVVGKKADNSLVVRSYTLKSSTTDPFSGGSWTATTMPALPTGWVPLGDPAIIHAPSAYSAMIVVTTSRPGQSGTRLYRSTTANGTTFGSWTQIATGLTDFGPPSIEIGYKRDATFRYTAYVLSTGSGAIYQGSTSPGTTTFETFTAIPNTGTTFASGPVALGGNLGADSTHAVFAKRWGSDNLYMTASVPGVE